MRVLFLSQYYRNRNRDEGIKKLVEGRNPIQREKWNLILGSVALGYLLYCCSTQKKKKKGKHFHSSRCYCKNITYISTFSLHKNLTRYIHFLFTSQTLSILPYSALSLETLTLGLNILPYGLWLCLVNESFQHETRK